MDAISLQRLNSLHPKIRQSAIDAFAEAEAALTGRAKPRVTFGMRTFKEQDELYAQGRTKPGQKVTNSKAGQSYHNYGLALDFALVIDGKTASWDSKTDFDADHLADWLEVVEAFKKHGFEWGGDWKGGFVDKPHFQKIFGKNWRYLLSLHSTGKIDHDGFIIF